MAVILTLVIRKQSSEISLLLSICVCCLVAGLAVGFMRPVMDFIRRLQSLGALDTDMLRILLKVVGVAFTAEIASLICEDSGNSAMGKTLQFLASGVILYLSIPMLTTLLDLVEGILGNV